MADGSSWTPPQLDAIHVLKIGRMGPLLGAGGQSKIYRLPDLRLPDTDRQLVYKQFKQVALRPELRRIVALRTHLLSAPSKLAYLDNITSWPLRRVVDDRNAVLGLVLPVIPQEFFQLLITAGTRTSRPIPREAQFLMAPEDRVSNFGLAVPTLEQRLAICKDMCEAIDFLHSELDVVFGDISARNVLYRVGGSPSVMLVDCDAVRVRGAIAAVRQLNSPDWGPPEGDVLSQTTDLYKLGLFVLRVLTPGPLSSINRNPAAAGARMDNLGMTLLTGALSGAPHARPSAANWARYFAARLARGNVRPVEAEPSGEVVDARLRGLRRDPDGTWRPASD